ncbi:MAG: AbrB/MazE/SpoVT family DNA-binding domain-containing protein [Candidatus Cloacimonadota bacterium]|nr:MAG: AbrB/MazE/SpoVT family DNA-binding domain-containing protein [Candidatus Cloacimonadota bacterium]
MKAKIIQIGNSKGLRLPKSIIEQCDLSNQVELIVDGTSLIIKAIEEEQIPRKGWNIAFKLMRKNNEDTLLIPDSFLDDEDFEW